MSNPSQWQAERERIRVAIGAPEAADLATVAAELRRRNSALEADNGRLRASLASARYLASESVHGSIAGERVIPAYDGVPRLEETSGGSESLADALECAECRGHLGSEAIVIDACASVAYETAQPVARVLAEYLALRHSKHAPR